MAQESQREISPTDFFGISLSNILEAVIGIILADMITIPLYSLYSLESPRFAFSLILIGGILVLEGIHIQRVNYLSRQIDGLESRIISFFDNLQTDGGTTDNTRRMSRWGISGGGLIGAFGGALIGAALGSFVGIPGIVVGSIIGAAGWLLIKRYSIPEDNDEKEPSHDMLATNELRESGRENVESLGEEQETEKNSQLSEIYQILGVVATNPQERFTSSEIARVTSMETSGVERGLHHLHALDRVDKSQDGEEESWRFKRQETEAGDFGELNDQQKKFVEQSIKAAQDAIKAAQDEAWDESELEFAEVFNELNDQQKRLVAQSLETFLDAQSDAEQQAEKVAETVVEQSQQVPQSMEEVVESANDVASESTDIAADADVEDKAEELESLQGLGPTYADRLREQGIQSITHLAQSNSETVADAAEVSKDRAEEWIERSQAQE